MGSSDTRIARALHLADGIPSASELLRFYAALVDYQKSLLVRNPSPAFGRDELLALIPGLLSWLADAAPASVREATSRLRRCTAAEWQGALDLVATSSPDALDSVDEQMLFVIEALIQPFAELTATDQTQRTVPEAPVGSQTVGRCPRCGDLPVVGVLREEGQGAKRSLVCARCLHEWGCLRAVCPSCGERNVDALPVYTAEQMAHVRIEACETCRQYLKTVDLTRDGLAVPIVDDLATVSLDLWAREQGYTRIRKNLLRL